DGGIYHYKTHRPQRQKDVRAAMDLLTEKYDKLPFASRWLTEAVDARRIPMVMRTLTRSGAVKSYGVLREQGDGLVAQAEHTLIVEEDGCTVTTLAD
ncbi:MAG: type II methionyl aminopeptidase, partial [Candidatus Thermoplasmatota archaeon]|nr:type II methionyl aminopeptidase [Candidatus Thermoplasmatota archaeon]